MYVALSALILGVIGAATHSLSRAARSRSRILESRLPLLACLEALSADVDLSNSGGVFVFENNVSLCPMRSLSSDARLLYDSSLVVYRWDAVEKVLSRFRLSSSELGRQGVAVSADRPVVPSGPVLVSLKSGQAKQFALGEWQIKAEDPHHLEVVASARGAAYRLTRRFNFNQ